MDHDNDDFDDKIDFKKNLTGYVYQLKLLLLFLWRGLKSGSCNKFQLGTELKEAEKFDDAIFFYETAAKTCVRYVQAKYRRFGEKKLKFKDFVNEWNGARCNLKKYFISFRKIKQRPYMIYQAELDDLIICTNIPFGKSTLTQNASDILTFRDVTGETPDEILVGMKKYQLMAVSSSSKLYQMLKLCTNLNLLAKELVTCIFKDNNILDLQDFWISGYFNVLIKENVIEQREEYYKLSMEDPKNDEQKNKDIRDFRQHFLEKRMQIDGIRYDNVMFSKNFIDKLKGQSGSVQATLEETADILVEHATKNIEVMPSHSTNMIFEKLGYLVKCDQSFFFTENFIHDSNELSKDAKYFRKLMMEACEKEVAKNLVGQEIYAVDALNGIMNYAWSAWSNNQNADEEQMAKDLIQHIFYKKALTNLFEPKYSFLKDVFKLTGMNTLQFTKDFAKNNNGNFRKLFLKLYAEEKLKKTTIKFKQDTTKYSLIIEQLKTSYETDDAKNTKVLKFDQTNWKKNKIGCLEALNGSIFVATKERDKIEFKKNIFTNIHQRIPNKIAQKFKKNLYNKFDMDFEKLKDYKIEYTNYPPHFDQLTEESTPINDDIETFRKKLFIVNTPSETELMKDISNEMGDRFNLLDGDTMTYNLFQKVMKWAKEKEDKLLNTTKVLKYMSDIEAKISEKFEVGCSLQYMCKLEDYSIIYNEIMDVLISFLGLPPFVPNHQKILHIQTNEKLLTAIKVCQTINSHPCFKKKDFFIFNPVKSLLRMENSDKHVSKAFSSTTDILIIVEKEVVKGLQEFCNVLYEIINNRPNKKILIISNETSPLISALKTLITDKIISILPQKVSFDDLITKSQNIIMQNTVINFQGCDQFLNKIINNEEASKLMDSNTLEKIINGDEIVIGEPVETCEEIKNGIYRPRQLSLIEVNDTLFEEKNLPEKNIFAIEGVHPSTQPIVDNNYDILIEKCKKKGIFFPIEASRAEEEFQHLYEKFPDFCIHWLKKGSNKLIWYHSYIPSSLTLSSKFKKHINRGKKYVLESFFGDYIKQNRVVIISDKAGMGKSTILTKFSTEIKTENQWIIRINLNQYTPVLLKIQRSKFKNDKQLYLNFDNFDSQMKDYGKLILESLITPECHQKKELIFENQIFNHFFTQRGILYMFDGFDEISPDYGDIVLTLLQMLRKNIRNRIWITSRRNFNQTLEDAFDTFAYDMKPFDRNDQEAFLKQYWISNYKREKGIHMPNQGRIPFYVKELLEEAPQKILDVIGIPLQTKMLAEIFQEKHDDDHSSWISCFDYAETEIPPVELNVSFKFSNIYTLYENFFKEKVVKYFLQEKGIVELSKPFANKLKKNVISVEYSVHKIFGYLALIDKNIDESLLTDHEKQIKNEWLNDFYTGVENIGIIDSFNSDGHPLFTHLTYAEYFAACFLVDKLCTSSSNAQKVFKAANEIFKKDVPVFVKSFLHLLKEEINNKELKEALEGKNILYFVMKHGFLNCINVFLHRTDLGCGFSKMELLHIAVKSDHVHVVAFITFCIWNVFSKRDDIFSCSLFTDLLKDDFLQTADLNPEVTDFFADVKKAADQHVIKKKYPFMKIEDYNEFFFRHVNFKKQITTNTPQFLNFFSCKNIIIILKVFKVIAFDGKMWITIFVDDICSRKDITDEEKIQIFEVILNDYIEKQNMNKAAEDILNQIIKNNCPDLIEKMLAIQKLKYDEKVYYECYEFACQYDHLEIIRKLLHHKIGINGWSFHYSPLDIAIKNKTRLETIIFINESIQTPINDVNKALFVAVEFNSNIKTIDYLRAKGADPNINVKRDSPWTLAVKNGNDDVIKCFLSHFDNLAFKKMAELLKKYYHDPRNFDWKKNVDEKFLLHQAIEEKNIPFCKFLIQKGADIHFKNSKGFTALELAREENLDEIVQLLIVYGASAEQFFKRMHSNSTILPFDEEVFKEFFGKIDVFENTLKKIKNAILNQKYENDEKGNTLLHFAAKHDDGKEIVIGLLKHGAFYNLENNNKETPESVASPLNKNLLNKIDECFCNAKKNKFIFNEDALLLFLKKSDIAAIKNKKGKTLLHYAVKMDAKNAVKTLLNFEADINETDNKNRTPVFYAIKNNNIKMLKLLLKKRNIDIPLVYSGQGYDEIEKNECKEMIVVVEKCLNHIFNEEVEEVKQELNSIKNNSDFNVIVSCSGIGRMSIAEYFLKCPKLLLYLYQKIGNVNILKLAAHIPFLGNSKLTNILRILIKIAGYVLSKKFTPESIINYYECHFIDAISYITTDKQEVDKIIANVRFNYYWLDMVFRQYDIVPEENNAFRGGTLLHIAAIVDDKEIAEWLINEKNADSYLEDYDGSNVYDLAQKYKSQNVLALMEKTAKNTEF